MIDDTAITLIDDTTNKLNKQEIENYFRFLDPNEKEIFSVAFLEDNSKKNVQGYGCVHLNSQNVITTAEELLRHNDNFTIHVVLNQTDLRGGKKANIKAVRVFVVDIDTAISLDTLREIKDRYSVHMIVESSPGKYHLYWKASPMCTLEWWEEVQKGLAFHFGGEAYGVNKPDYGMAVVTQRLRIPGCLRVTKDGELFMPRIVWLSQEYEELWADAINALFPDLERWVDGANDDIEVQRKELKKSLKSYKAGKKLDVSNLKSGRNNFLYAALKREVWKTDITWDELHVEAKNINKSFSTPLDSVEVKQVVKSAWERGLDARHMREQGLKEQEDKRRKLADMLEDETVDEDSFLNGAGINAAVNGSNGHHGNVPNRPATEASEYSDMAIVERFIDKHQDELLEVQRTLFVFDRKKKLWFPQGRGDYLQLFSMLRDLSLEMSLEEGFRHSFSMTDDGHFSEAKHTKALNKFLSAGHYSRIVNMLFNSDLLPSASMDVFDSKEHLLFVNNGVLNMVTGELRKPEGRDRLLQKSQVNWNSQADYTWFESFMREVFAENEDPEAMVAFMKRVFGYTLGGSIREQKIFCHFGDGSNGKSKVMEALALITGGYGTIVEPDEMVKSKGGFGKSFERFGAKVEGKRCVIVDDIDVKTVWNEGFVKTITGKRIRARAEYQRSREVPNRAKFHLGLNSAPEPEAENHGILRRLCLIPYNRTFKATGAMALELDDRMEATKEGILKWAVEGYRELLEHGLQEPVELDKAIEAYKEEHFTGEVSLKALFEVLPDDAPGGSWETVSDMVNDVNRYLETTGIGGKIDSKTLVKSMKRTFGSLPQKRWDAAKKNAFRQFYVRLCFIRDDKASLL